jgi:cell division septum initiation protein DivIVA
LKWLRSTATSYAAFIPGAKSYVDAAFDDLGKIQDKHGDEVDKIVNNTYKDLKEATKSGMSMQTVAKTWEILEKTLKDLAQLASDSANEILDNHPKLKESVGGNLDQLKKMADSYGPEAKKELDETYQQIKDVIKAGVSFETINKLKKIIEEKTEKVKKLGDQAWTKGIEQAKPYLDKSPEIKKVVEDNADLFKQGNIEELFAKVKEAASSGNAESLKDYAKKATEKAKDSGLGKSLEQYAKMIPGGNEIIPKLQKLQEVAKNKSGDAEKILTEAYKDVQGIIEKRTKELESLAEDAKKASK